MSDPEQQAIDFFAQWGESFDALCQAFEARLAPDCVWDQRPIPRLTGPDAAVRFLRLARCTMGLATIDVEVLRMASQGDIVHVERVDSLRRADGSLIVSAPVAGVLTFSGDCVVHWREYFDSGSLIAHTLASGMNHLARRTILRRAAGTGPPHHPTVPLGRAG